MIIHTDLIAFLGGQTAVANILGISPQAVYKWGDEIPRARLAELAIATGEGGCTFNDLSAVENVWPELKNIKSKAATND